MFLGTAVSIGSFPVFFDELLDYFGWSRGSLALGFTLNMLFMSIFGLLSGFIMNRIGIRLTVISGAVISGISIALISLTTQQWHFYVTFGLLLPLGNGISLFVPTISTVRRWFSRRAALAISLALMGAALGATVGPFVSQILINSFGWQNAYRLLALVLTVGLTASALMLKKDPESLGLYPDGAPMDNTKPEQRVDFATRSETWSMHEAIKTRALWLYILSQAGFIAVGNSVMAHLKVWAEKDLGLGEGYALAMVSIMPLMAGISRIPGGIVSDKLMDRFGRKPVLYFCILGVTICSFGALAVDNRFSLALFAIMLGLTSGNGTGIFPTYLGDLFGVVSLPILLGFVMLGSSMLGALGPWFFGAIYDQMGSYNIAFIVGGILCILSLICLFLIKTPTRKLTTLQ